VDTTFQAAIPEPFQILGLKLLPLSLGRYRILHRLGCAFVSDKETNAGIPDLILGVSICSMRCDEFLDAFETGKYFKFLKSWGKRINARPPWYLRGKYGRIISATFIGRHWRKNHSFNFFQKIELFKNYISEAQKQPEYVPVHYSEHVVTAHWSEATEIILRSELGWTAEEINEAPLSKAISDCLKYLEQQGMVRIFSPEEIELGKQNAAALEKAYAAMNGENHGA